MDKTPGDYVGTKFRRIFVGAFPTGDLAERHDAKTARVTAPHVTVAGTYWHNDYGRPRSHGCLNVPPLVARWFWRWTTPAAPYDEVMYWTPRNATVTIINVA